MLRVLRAVAIALPDDWRSLDAPLDVQAQRWALRPPSPD
jgi:hypothetical protein